MFGTIAELEGMIPINMTTSSSPSRDQVIKLLETHSSVLEVLIRSWGIPVPETSTAAYTFLARITLLRTAADVYRRKALEKGEDGSRMAEVYDMQADALQKTISDSPQSIIERD